MAWWIFIGILVLIGVYLYLQNNWFSLSKYQIHLPNLANEFKGKHIIFLSDIHIKDRTKDRFLKTLLENIKEQEPDLILLGGDIIHADISDHSLEIFNHFLGNLVKIAPVKSVLGNHETENPRTHDIIKIYEKHQIQLLLNEGVALSVSDLTHFQSKTDDHDSETKELEKNETNFETDEHPENLTSGNEAKNLKVVDQAEQPEVTEKSADSLHDIPIIVDEEHEGTDEFDQTHQNETSNPGLVILGLSDKEQTYIIRKDPVSRISVEEEWVGLPTILLVHYPQFYENYLSGDSQAPHLILAGHNHGGQMILPFVGGLYAPRQGFNPKYDFGVFTSKDYPDSRMIVSRGIGNSEFPLRVNNRPEIIMIELI